VVHADETGWRTNGRNGFLWALTTDRHTVYDQFDSSMQKCIAHLLRELKQTIEKHPALKDHAFFVTCKRQFQSMLRLKTKQATMEKDQYARQVVRCECDLKNLSQKTCDDSQANRLGKRLRKHLKSLTTFLHKTDVDPTNNAAERAIRPVVVMRKFTGGSRSDSGAKAFAVLASIVRTARQQGRDVLATIRSLLQSAWAGEELTLLTNTS